MTSDFRPFKDRRDAGAQLASALMHLKKDAPVVLALPRGGAPVAYEVALALGVRSASSLQKPEAMIRLSQVWHSPCLLRDDWQYPERHEKWRTIPTMPPKMHTSCHSAASMPTSKCAARTVRHQRNRHRHRLCAAWRRASPPALP